MKPVVFQNQAEAELDEAAAWYERRKPGLGQEFVLSVEEAIQRIRDNPQIGSRFRTTRFRYVLVRRFPYVVFYTEIAHAVRVMAVAHGRRRPGYWRNSDKQSFVREQSTCCELIRAANCGGSMSERR